MVKPRKPLRFEPSRLKRGSSEEVRVGAYARQQRRRRVLIGTFGALLIAGAFILYQQLLPWSETKTPNQRPIRVRCLSCGETATVHVRPAQTFPMRCSQCGEMTLLELWQCRDCGARFVPEQTGTLLRCPACNSQRVGSAAAP
ncbi:MAG: hypothetical protein ACE5I3_15395 [Phycisphaerae bacterium]